MAELTPQQLAEELERMRLSLADSQQKTQIMENMLNQIGPALEALRGQVAFEQTSTRLKLLNEHARGILHAMELLPEFANGKVTAEGLATKITAATAIYKASMNAAVQIEVEQQRARQVQQ